MKGLLITYGLTFGGAIAALFNPFYGLLVYICFSIIKPDAMWHWSVPQGNYSLIVAIALLIGWALNGFGDWRLLRAKPTVFAFIFFWLWALASTYLCSIDRDLSWKYLTANLKILLPFLVGITTIRTKKHIKMLAWTIVLSLSYLAFEFNMSYFAGNNTLYTDGFAGMDNNSVAIALVTGCGLAFFLGLSVDDNDKTSRRSTQVSMLIGQIAFRHWQKVLAFGGALFMANAIMFSFSRGGLLALAVTGVVAIVLTRKSPKHFKMLVVAGFCAFYLAGPEVRERFISSFTDTDNRDASAQSRMDLWADCWDLTLKNPFFGVGPDHWPFYAQDRYGWPTQKEAHSLWFQTAAEMGLVGVGLLLSFYGMTILQLWMMANRMSGKS